MTYRLTPTCPRIPPAETEIAVPAHFGLLSLVAIFCTEQIDERNFLSLVVAPEVLAQTIREQKREKRILFNRRNRFLLYA